MDVQEFFLQEYDTVCWIVNDLFLKGVSDDQIATSTEGGLELDGMVSLAHGPMARLCEYIDRY